MFIFTNTLMVNEETLRIIQSGTQKEMYLRVTSTALYMATGGYLDQANLLLNGLWKHHLPHDKDAWLPDRAFMVLWNAAGKKPGFIPFALINIDTLEKNQRAEHTLDKWAVPQKDGDWHELTGIDLLRKVYQLAGPERKKENPSLTLDKIINPDLNKQDSAKKEDGLESILGLIQQYANDNWNVKDDDKMPGAEKELLALEMLEKYIQEQGKDNSAISLAAELSAKNGKKEKAIYFAELWAINFYDRDKGYMNPEIASNKYLAVFLLEHCIAKQLQLTSIKCDKFSAKAITAIDNRIQKGRTLVYGNLSWKALLEKLSVSAIAYSPDDYTADIAKAKWLGFTKATEAAITATEQRLGIALPDDYKEFLRITNGFRNFPLMNPPLLPAEKIDYLRNVEKAGMFGSLQNFPVDDNDPETYAEYTYRCILISEQDEEQWVWLIPPKNTKGEWQTWFFAYWIPGEKRYPSFRHFIEEQLSKLDK
jgi:hypothetical protein